MNYIIYHGRHDYLYLYPISIRKQNYYAMQYVMYLPINKYLILPIC